MLISDDTNIVHSGDGSQEYYAHNAKEYYDSTINIDLTCLYQYFLKYLPKGSLILDAGSGSGRDTLSFLRLGYVVEAFDASPQLSELSFRRTGVPVRVMRFQEFCEVSRYDGIWACASLLHVPKVELHDVLVRLISALKLRGVLYMSFKHGIDEYIAADGRIYSDFTEEKLSALLHTIPDIRIMKMWLSENKSQVKMGDQWLNAIVQH